jgi:tRNA (adenine22-N1)-methyltransferase
MKQIRLTNRLQTIANLIDNVANVVDVGTDHGYLPVWLAQNDRAHRIAATDIRQGPLASAKASAEEYGVPDRIEFVLTDGLSGIDGSAFDFVVIAGMGGETIAGILEKATWTRSGSVRLILQPQTKLDELTAWLRRAGYQVFDASLANDGGRMYIVLVAGAGRSGAFREPRDILLEKRDPLLPEYLTSLITKARKALDGLRQSETQQDETAAAIRLELDIYESLREETAKWQR